MNSRMTVYTVATRDVRKWSYRTVFKFSFHYPISFRREVWWLISSWTSAITPFSLLLLCSDNSTYSGAIYTIHACTSLSCDRPSSTGGRLNNVEYSFFLFLTVKKNRYEIYYHVNYMYSTWYLMWFTFESLFFQIFFFFQETIDQNSWKFNCRTIKIYQNYSTQQHSNHQMKCCQLDCIFRFPNSNFRALVLYIMET